MIQTIIKIPVLTAALLLLNAPSYAEDAFPPLQSGVEQPTVPSGLTETPMQTKKNEYREFWTGFYGGISVGGNFSSVDLRSNHPGLINPDGTCNVDASLDSFFPGVQFGYAHQFDSKVVLGAEADFTYNVDERENITCPCPPFLRATDRFRARNRLQGSLRGRLGYALDHHLLPFISAGISFADMGIEYRNEAGDSYNNNSAQVGWLVGAGLEWGFSDELRLLQKPPVFMANP